MRRNYLIAITLVALGFGLVRCKIEANPNTSNYVDTTAEIGGQIADVMASIDEMGKSTGTIQTLATCYGNGFGACVGNSVTRNFGSCMNGTYTFAGTSLLTWGGTSVACAMQNPGDFILRKPNYTITGGRFGSASVFKNSTNGETLTWLSGAAPKVFSYNSDGIRKTIGVSGTLYYDVTTSTAGNLTVTGQARAGRVMNGGTLEILNNINGAICTISPQNVTWADANCTCGSAGSWQGTCGDGSLIRLDLTDCGHGQMTLGTYSEIISFDRCQNN